MAESVVSFVLERLGDLLIEEAKFIHGVGGQVLQIRDELRWMKAFLRDAEAKQNEEQRIREWVADVRTLAYDAGDVLESFLLKVESKRGGGIKDILKRYVCILNECVVLHKVGSEIENIKAGITELKSRLKTYGIRSLSDAQDSSNSASERQNQLRRTYSHIIEDDFVGLEGDVEKLVGHLVKDQKDGNEYYLVVSICGMGGLGKTTLARKVYNHAEVKRHFDAFAWVCISQKWQPTDILQQILNKLIPEEKDRIVKSSDDELIRKLFNIQKEKRCLIVLDDIWSKDAWDCLINAFPREGTKSKLLLTSRNAEVASYVDPEGFLHEPQLLNDDESWKLLKKKAFSKRDHTDLSPLPYSQYTNLDGKKKAEFVKQIHEKARLNIERRTEQYAKQANKGRQKRVFEPGDWVWLHMRKERFPEQRRSKLLPRGDGPFQVLERVNDNAYKLDLPGEYKVSATFNVSDLSPYDTNFSPFDAGNDLRANPFQEEGNDGDKAYVRTEDNSKVIQVPIGPVTRSRAKQFKAALNGLMQVIWAQEQGTIKPIEGEKHGTQSEGWVTLIQAQID